LIWAIDFSGFPGAGFTWEIKAKGGTFSISNRIIRLELPIYDSQSRALDDMDFCDTRGPTIDMP